MRMKTQSEDTSPEIERVQIELLRKMSPSRRLQLGLELSSEALEIAQRAIKRAHPELSDLEAKLLFVEVTYGKDLADRVRSHLVKRNNTMSNEKVLAALIPVVETFEQLGIDYYVGGSVASLMHGIYRTTADVDIVADMRIVDVEAFVLYLQDTFYLDADSIKEAIRRRTEFSLLHFKTMFKVDIFLPKNRPFDLAVRSRVQEGTLTDSQESPPVIVESPEDVVLTKLEWYKMGGGVSDRQWNDILGVLKVRGTTLDMQYLRHWANALGVADLLERALEDAGLKE